MHGRQLESNPAVPSCYRHVRRPNPHLGGSGLRNRRHLTNSELIAGHTVEPLHRITFDESSGRLDNQQTGFSPLVTASVRFEAGSEAPGATWSRHLNVVHPAILARTYTELGPEGTMKICQITEAAGERDVEYAFATAGKP